MTKIILVVALSLTLAALTTTLPLRAAAGESPEQVIDTSGKKLRAGANYYVVPSPTPQEGAGLGLATIGNKDCPFYVVAVNGYSGLPLSFYPVNIKKGVVRVSTDLNIAFSSTTTSCPQTTVWKLDDYDYTTGQWFVTTGGVFGNPGWQTINNWFKIEKYEESYKLMYCPSVCPSCEFQCRNIGIYYDGDGNQRLALTDVPYKVQFQQA